MCKQLLLISCFRDENFFSFYCKTIKNTKTYTSHLRDVFILEAKVYTRTLRTLYLNVTRVHQNQTPAPPSPKPRSTSSGCKLCRVHSDMSVTVLAYTYSKRIQNGLTWRHRRTSHIYF